MKTNLLFTSAAVAAVLVMTTPAHAQVLGAGARGGAAGALAGSFGGVSGVGGMADMNGRMSAASDASARGGFPRRAVDRSARTAARAGARASGGADGAASVTRNAAAGATRNDAPGATRNGQPSSHPGKSGHDGDAAPAAHSYGAGGN